MRRHADRGEHAVAGAEDGERGGGGERQRRADEVARRWAATPPTAPRSNCAGRVSLAPAIARQLAAKLISTPNSAAWPSASHCGLGSGATGRSGPASLATSAGAAAPTARPARMASPAISAQLDQQHRVDRPPRRADQLEDGDALAARGGEGGGGARHAEPADRQRRQRHHQQQLAEPVDEPPRAAAGVVAVGGAPAAVGKALLEGVADGLRVGAVGQEQAVATCC